MKDKKLNELRPNNSLLQTKHQDLLELPLNGPNPRLHSLNKSQLESPKHSNQFEQLVSQMKNKNPFQQNARKRRKSIKSKVTQSQSSQKKQNLKVTTKNTLDVPKRDEQYDDNISVSNQTVFPQQLNQLIRSDRKKEQQMDLQNPDHDLVQLKHSKKKAQLRKQLTSRAQEKAFKDMIMFESNSIQSDSSFSEDLSYESERSQRQLRKDECPRDLRPKVIKTFKKMLSLTNQQKDVDKQSLVRRLTFIQSEMDDWQVLSTNQMKNRQLDEQSVQPLVHGSQQPLANTKSDRSLNSGLKPSKQSTGNSAKANYHKYDTTTLKSDREHMIGHQDNSSEGPISHEPAVFADLGTSRRTGEFKLTKKQALKSDGVNRQSSLPRRATTQLQQATYALFRVILPQNKYLKAWDLLVTCALFSTCVIYPYQLAFNFFEEDDEEDNFSKWFFRIVDWLFLIDILVNFNQAFYCNKTHQIIVDRKIIALRYIKSWFLIDVIAVFPYDWLTTSSDEEVATNEGGQFQGLVKMAKLSRMYRAIKLTRIFKATKMVRQNQLMRIKQRWNKTTRVKIAIERLVVFGIIFALVVHFQACIWIFISSFQLELGQTSWAEEGGYAQMRDHDLYITAVYFTITTMTTVGYGDISATTTAERILSIVAMVFGVSAFGFATGSLSSILTNQDSTDAQLREKLSVVGKLQNEYDLSNELAFRIEQFVILQTALQDQQVQEFIAQLPERLRVEVSLVLYREHRKTIFFLQNLEDENFIAWLCPLLKPIQIIEDTFIQTEQDPIEHICFMQQGEASYTLTRFNNFEYVQIDEGDHFGVADIVFRAKEKQQKQKLKQNQDFFSDSVSSDSDDEWDFLGDKIKFKFTIRSTTPCILLQLEKKELNRMRIEFPEVFLKLMQEENDFLKKTLFQKVKAVRHKEREIALQQSELNELDSGATPNILVKALTSSGVKDPGQDRKDSTGSRQPGEITIDNPMKVKVQDLKIQEIEEVSESSDSITSEITSSQGSGINKSSSIQSDPFERDSVRLENEQKSPDVKLSLVDQSDSSEKHRSSEKRQQSKPLSSSGRKTERIPKENSSKSGVIISEAELPVTRQGNELGRLAPQEVSELFDLPCRNRSATLATKNDNTCDRPGDLQAPLIRQVSRRKSVRNKKMDIDDQLVLESFAVQKSQDNEELQKMFMKPTNKLSRQKTKKIKKQHTETEMLMHQSESIQRHQKLEINVQVPLAKIKSATKSSPGSMFNRLASSPVQGTPGLSSLSMSPEQCRQSQQVHQSRQDLSQQIQSTMTLFQSFGNKFGQLSSTINNLKEQQQQLNLKSQAILDNQSKLMNQ